MSNPIEQMVTVTLPTRVWDEVSELLWARLPIPVCEGCGGIESDGCGICMGTGLGTMYHPALDDEPVAIAAREIDQRIVSSYTAAPGLRALNELYR